eukprot:1157809-Pelagomonas_calceolata.AAC.4
MQCGADAIPLPWCVDEEDSGVWSAADCLGWQVNNACQSSLHALASHVLHESLAGARGTVYQCHLYVRKDWLG